MLTEEYPPMTVKGFVRPINVYKVLGTYQALVDERRWYCKNVRVYGCWSTLPNR